MHFTYKLPANPAALFWITVGSGGLHMIINSWSDCITTPGNCGNQIRTCTNPYMKEMRIWFFFSLAKWSWFNYISFKNTTSGEICNFQIVGSAVRIAKVLSYQARAICFRIHWSIIGKQWCTFKPGRFLQTGGYLIGYTWALRRKWTLYVAYCGQKHWRGSLS